MGLAGLDSRGWSQVDTRPITWLNFEQAHGVRQRSRPASRSFIDDAIVVRVVDYPR